MTTNSFSSFFRISSRVVEDWILLADSTLRSVQENLGRMSGQTPPSALTKPPMGGPADLDAATSEFSNRVARIVQHTPLKANALLGASNELLEAAIKSYSYDKSFGEWLMMPLQLPFSIGTILTEQSLRALHVLQTIDAGRVPQFIAYTSEIFNDLHIYLSLQYKEELTRYLERVRRDPSDSEARLALGRTYIKCGQYAEAVRELALAAQDPRQRRRALYESTVANCRAGNYSQAVKDGGAAVALDPSDEKARYWLWLAARKIGDYPPEIAPDLRMDLVAGQHATSLEFEEVAGKIGLDKTSGGRGTAIFDYDGDGYLDLVVTSTHGGCSLYHNNGDGTFTEASIGSGLDHAVNVFGAIAGDYNNDGLPDLYLIRLGFFAGECELYRNNGDGTFSNVTQEAGLACWGPAFTASWVDYDCDGHLDLFVANNLGGLFERKNPNRLFHNNGDGTFTEVAEKAGIKTIYPTIGHSWGDYNNDGFPDLFVSNPLAPSQLFRNNGDGTFTDVSREAGVDDPGIGSVASWCDYDNDGWLDLIQFVWSPPEDAIYTMRTGHGPEHGDPLRIYHNNRDGTFSLRSRELGVDECWGTMSGNIGDFNNDGFPDLLLGNGDPQMDRTEPPIIFENDRGKRFRNVTFAAGLPFTGKGHGANMADLAGDGRLSLIIAMGGLYPGDLLTTAVYRPKRLPGNYLNVRLVGVRSNRDGIGARLELRAGGNSQHNLVSGGSGFGCMPYEQHFGLGQLTEIETLRIHWPSGLEQWVENLPVNETIRIVEGEAGWQPVYSQKHRARKKS